MEVAEELGSVAFVDAWVGDDEDVNDVDGDADYDWSSYCL